MRIILLILIINVVTFAQTGKLKGTVTTDGEPLPGVNILLLETTIGGVSNLEGSYEILNLEPGKYKARFSAVGHATKFFDIEIIAGRTLELNVVLETEDIEVDVVEVVDKRIQEQKDTRTSLIDLQPREARAMPGAVTDVFRTLHSLPGVLAPNDFSSQLVIRGSTPDQNLIIMDDVEIFNPYRLYGVISMFNPEAVSDINLETGGFSAKYGDRLSAVLDVTNKQGTRTENLKGNLNASIVAANLVLEGKNPFGVAGSWLVNSRRTYYDLIIEPFVKNSGLVEENVSFPNFYDIQTKLAFGPFKGHKFFINGIYSRDAVRVVSGENRTTPDSVGVQDLSKNDMASFAYHYAPNKNVLNKVIASWYSNQGDTDFSSEFLDPSLNRKDFEDALTDTLSAYLFNFRFKSNYTFEKYSVEDKFIWFWGEKSELEVGAGVDFLKTVLDFDFEFGDEIRAFFNSNPNIRATLDDIKDIRKYNRYKAYAFNNFAISDKFFIQPGFRYDYFDILEKGFFSPRVALSYALDDITTLRASWGIYLQSPGYEKLRDRNILYDLTPELTRNLNPERALHYVLSFDRWITSEWNLKIETYYKDFYDLIERDIETGRQYYSEPVPGLDRRNPDSWTRPVANFTDSLTQIPLNKGDGEAYGLELYLEKRNIAGFDRINGRASYALAWADRFEDGRKTPFRYDQRHTFNLVMSYRVNSWFDIGVRFQYGSGFPLTEAVGIKPRILLEDNDGDLIPETPVIATRTSADGLSREVIFDVDYGDQTRRYSSRKPEYHRLDLRFNFAADYWDLDWVFYLDVINVYNRSNIINYDYYISDELTLEREATSMFPILPTIGFNVRF